MVSGKPKLVFTMQKSLDTRITLIKPSKGWSALNLRDLWVYRELILFMTWRDLKVRYKQTLLGAGWAVLQPFLTMVVFSIFIHRADPMDSFF
jgi:lipopolysaccharide transport system permease protein